MWLAGGPKYLFHGSPTCLLLNHLGRDRIFGPYGQQACVNRHLDVFLSRGITLRGALPFLQSTFGMHTLLPRTILKPREHLTVSKFPAAGPGRCRAGLGFRVDSLSISSPQRRPRTARIAPAASGGRARFGRKRRRVVDAVLR
jgi:hypothetical protein